ncbi:hypothetical protein H5410_017812 [Solanum commersonii]|uniref:Uncharacterized protein n=1 Tax=Solanum commersonii TaxID=4109 RepID=A0A9J6A1F1_SOLCO|nr:hypothetical protein H5410_017812 [Solanum commersonii]
MEVDCIIFYRSKYILKVLYGRNCSSNRKGSSANRGMISCPKVDDLVVLDQTGGIILYYQAIERE